MAVAPVVPLSPGCNRSHTRLSKRIRIATPTAGHLEDFRQGIPTQPPIHGPGGPGDAVEPNVAVLVQSLGHSFVVLVCRTPELDAQPERVRGVGRAVPRVRVRVDPSFQADRVFADEAGQGGVVPAVADVVQLRARVQLARHVAQRLLHAGFSIEDAGTPYRGFAAPREKDASDPGTIRSGVARFLDTLRGLEPEAPRHTPVYEILTTRVTPDVGPYSSTHAASRGSYPNSAAGPAATA